MSSANRAMPWTRTSVDLHCHITFCTLNMDVSTARIIYLEKRLSLILDVVLGCITFDCCTWRACRNELEPYVVD